LVVKDGKVNEVKAVLELKLKFPLDAKVGNDREVKDGFELH
jgi:hypothetical protein